MTYKTMQRREFLGASAAVAAPWIVPASVFANPPSDRLTHACIGCDGMGWSDLQSLVSHERIEIVAICDVDVARQAKAAERLPQARRYQDWRELLSAEGDRIDSINVAVPDHMHAPISMSAIRQGKHVYCQKPLAHEVSEARALRLAADEMNVTTQMGNQIQSASVYRTAVKALRQGFIGRVKDVHVWIGAKYSRPGRPAGSDPIPDSLDWDLWLGVASERPYKANVYHPFEWRCWQDFGVGAMGDFGCHILDTPYKALQLTAPESIQAEVPDEWASNEASRQESWPAAETIHFVFPATPFTDGKLQVTWYDGERRPPIELFGFADGDRMLPGGGALFIGEHGKLLLPHVGPPEFLPGSQRTTAELPKVEGFSHYHAYVDACLGEGLTDSSFAEAGPLTEATLLGAIANRLPGEVLEWDADAMRIVNSAAADQLVRPKYRQGWTIPNLG